MRVRITWKLEVAAKWVYNCCCGSNFATKVNVTAHMFVSSKVNVATKMNFAVKLNYTIISIFRPLTISQVDFKFKELFEVHDLLLELLLISEKISKS